MTQATDLKRKRTKVLVHSELLMETKTGIYIMVFHRPYCGHRVKAAPCAIFKSFYVLVPFMPVSLHVLFCFSQTNIHML